MEEILEKGKRLKHPRSVTVQLRLDVYDWLCSIANLRGNTVGFVIRALIEDYYDYAEHPDPAQEVPGDA